MKKININNIPTKIKIIALIVITLLLAGIVFSQFNSFRKKTSNTQVFLSQTYLKKDNLIANTQRIINSFIVFNHISYEKLDDFIDIQNSFFQTNDSISQIKKEYKSLITSIDESKVLDEFTIEYQIFQNIIYEIFNEYKKEEINLKNISRLFNKELYTFQNLTSILKSLKQTNDANFTEIMTETQSNLNRIILRIIIIYSLFLALIILLSILLFKNDVQLHSIIEPYLSKLSTGETISVKKTHLNYESVKSISNISQNYKQINSYINELTKQNYKFELDVMGSNDVISKSLEQLRDNLIDTQEEFLKRQKEDEQKEWANSGINKFSEIMRLYSNDLVMLSDNIIKELVKYLNASVGGLFITQSADTDEPYLLLQSAFAYDRKKYYTKKILFGEGLLGTVAIDQTTIYLDQVPQNYLEIESGLGDTAPNNLLIIPLMTDSGLLGILEIASLQKIEKYEIEFTEDLSRSIAATIENVKINDRTRDLLIESQKKSEELISREKILQETMEEVSKTHQIAKRNELEMTGILSGVDQTLMRAEYTVEGNFINSNLFHRQTMGYDIETMFGKNIMEFIQKEEKENFKRIWATVAGGKPYQITVKRKNRQTNADIWLLNQYTPIKDDKAKVIKVLYLAIDVTEQKLAEENSNKLLKDTQEKEVELQGILSGIDRSIMRAEYSTDGMFLTSNEEHKSVMGYEYEQMKGKNILDFIPEEQKMEFRKMWREVVSGKPNKLTVKRLNQSTGEEIWLINQYNPIVNEMNNVVKVLYLAIDITEQKIVESQVKELLKKSQDKEYELQGIFSGIDQTIMRAEFDVTGVFQSGNNVLVQTFGFNKNEMIGKNIEDLVSEENVSSVHELWNNITKGKLEQITTNRINPITNDEIWILNQFTPIEDQFGNITKVLYLGIDITEQKLAEAKAGILLDQTKQKELEYNNVVNSLDQTLMRAEYKVDGTFIDANLKHQEKLGYKKEDMLSKNIRIFVPNHEHETFNEVWSKVISGKPQSLIVKRQNFKTNRVIWIKNQYNPIFDKKNEVIEVQYLGIDITEEKQLEEQTKDLLESVKENEANLSTLISALDQSLIRAEFSTDGTFMTANDFFEDVLGYTIEELKGKNIIELVKENELEDFNKLWIAVMNGETKQMFVQRQNRRTGEDIWLRNQYTPVVDIDGKLKKILYLAYDISEQKNLEKMLVLQERIMQQNMEKIYKEKETLLEENNMLKSADSAILHQENTEEDEQYNKWIDSLN